MTRAEIFEGVNEVFRDVFDDESITVGETTMSKDIEDWDSLEHINLVIAIEKKFNMRFTMGEVAKLENVGAMVNMLMERAKP